MSTKNKDNNTTPQAQPEKQQLGIGVVAQYIKDLSFENPHSPQNIGKSDKAPNISINIDVKVKHLENNRFEVILAFSAKADRDEKTNLFVAELAYAGVFDVTVPEKDLEPILMIYCPGLLFPFARQILAETVQNSGFPPLLIDPIDFADLFRKNKEREAKAANK